MIPLLPLILIHFFCDSIFFWILICVFVRFSSSAPFSLPGGGRFTHTMFRRQVPRFLLTPQRVARLRGVRIRRVGCGEGHVLAIDERGRAFTWGMASNGQLGLGMTGDQVSPIQIVQWPTSDSSRTGQRRNTGENGLPFVSVVACGARHSCAVDRRGRLYTWGGSGGCMLGIPTDLAVDVSAIRHTSVRGRFIQRDTVDLSTQAMGANDPSLHVAARSGSENGGGGGGGGGGESGGGDASGGGGGGSGRFVDRPWMKPRMVRSLSSSSRSGSGSGRGERSSKAGSKDKHRYQNVRGEASTEAYHEIITQVTAGADHTVCVTAAGEVYSWGGIVEHVTHGTLAEGGGENGKLWRKRYEKKIQREEEKDQDDPLMSKEKKRERKNLREQKYVEQALEMETDDTPMLVGRSLGVLGDGAVRSFTNSPVMVGCRAQVELEEHRRRERRERGEKASGGSRSGSSSAMLTVASLAQRRTTCVACSGWHTLVVTSGTHVGMDLRRPFEPGFGRDENTATGPSAQRDNTFAGLNRGLGHWASDLILLVGSSNSGSKDIATKEEERMEEIVRGADRARSESRAIYCHQVVIRHRSAVLAEKIREEERRVLSGGSSGSGGRRGSAMTILLPDLDFKVALVLVRSFGFFSLVFSFLFTCQDVAPLVHSFFFFLISDFIENHLLCLLLVFSAGVHVHG